MAKSAKKARKLSTNEALERLLGRKAAKRLRRLAVQYAADKDEQKAQKKNRTRKKGTKQKKNSRS